MYFKIILITNERINRDTGNTVHGGIAEHCLNHWPE